MLRGSKAALNFSSNYLACSPLSIAFNRVESSNIVMAVSTAPELIILDPDGDAILQVGENPTHQSNDEGSGCALQIRISTKLLAMSSPVFKAMLSGRFAEGQLPFTKENPPSLVLPEDDPDAVRNYCKIIHHAQDAQFPLPFGAL